MSVKIFHNPRCRKSRETLEILHNKNIEPEIFLYLEKKLTKAELKKTLKALEMKAEEIVRKSEAVYKENFKGQVLSESEWLDAMIKYPKLIERPIVIKGDKAIIGRPPENVLKLL